MHLIKVLIKFYLIIKSNTILSIEQSTEILKKASWMRGVQKAIADNYCNQLMRCPVHLSSGQEAVAAVFSKLAKRKLLYIHQIIDLLQVM